MEVPLFPRPQRLAREFLRTQLLAVGNTQHVGTKNPSKLPSEWIRLRSQGGPQTLYDWRVMLEVFVFATDEVVAEGNAIYVHSLLSNAAGVGIVVPEFEGPFPWVRKAVHVSGPTSIEPDEDLPNLEAYRIVTTWHVLPIPKG